MSADFIPITVFGLAMLVFFPLVALMAVKRRQNYCGKNSKPCFWCNRDCKYHALVRLPRVGAFRRAP